MIQTRRRFLTLVTALMGTAALAKVPVSHPKYPSEVEHLLAYIKKTITEGNRFALFEPNDAQTWATIQAANQRFLNDLITVK